MQKYKKTSKTSPSQPKKRPKTPEKSEKNKKNKKNFHKKFAESKKVSNFATQKRETPIGHSK